jgi:GNAT superfamily N-acetyltransferase
LGADENRPPFTCGCNDDLDEYFREDSKTGAKDLIAVTYAVEISGKVIAFFTVSNDAIRSEDTTNQRFKNIRKNLSPSTRGYLSMPAVKIGRFATAKDYQRQGIGTQILDFIKMWFTKNNKTGCRFIIVDAANNENTLEFYEKNEFEFLPPSKKKKNEKTRLMYFDLMLFKEQLTN